MEIWSEMKKHKNRLFTRVFQDFSAWILLLPALFCIYITILRPQVLGMIWSFFDMRGFTVTEFAGVENYKNILTNSVFYKTFFNTLKYVVCSLAIGFIIPIITAIIMNELIHCRNAMRVIVYLPSVMPMVAVSLLWYFIYYPDGSGLLNMLLVKIGLEPYTWLQDSRFTILYIVISMTWSGMGVTAIYYFSALQSVNRELFEAALIDGAGFINRLRVVTLPHMSGMIILFLARHIIGVFNILEEPLQMTDGGPNNASMSLRLLNYKWAFVEGRPQLALALGVIMFIIMSVMAIGYFKLSKQVEDNLA